MRSLAPFARRTFALAVALGVCGSAGCTGGSPANKFHTLGNPAATTGTGGAADTCGPGTGGAGGGVGAPSGTFPASHPKMPKVVSSGGPVLASPAIYPVFFAGDDVAFTAQLADFTSKIGATAYWAANATEYGVGAAKGKAAIQLTETAAAQLQDSDIQTWLSGKLNGDDPAFPVADPNTLIALFYPSGTTISDTSGNQTVVSCKDFGGYHSNITLDGTHAGRDVAYVVMPRCPTFLQLAGLDATTGAASHELLEASTDPYPQTHPAFQKVDDAQLPFVVASSGGEIGDLCVLPSSFVKVAGFPYTVQRCWSNAAAAESHDPCVPQPAGEAYFNSAPVLPDTFTVPIGTSNVQVDGVQVPAGSTKTIELDLYSDATTTGPWTVQAQELGGSSLSFCVDQATGSNGQKLHLSISADANASGGEVFVIFSTLGEQQSYWVGVVGN